MRILIVIPCLNEEAHLPALLDQIGSDPAAHDACIVVADGGSSDRSAEIVRARAASDRRITLLSNARQRQGAGVNLAVAQHGAHADVVVRIDAHADYPNNFVSRLIAAQHAFDADSVTVSMRAVSRKGACFQRAAATAQNSVLGAGGSLHRKEGVRRWVDHGHHALFTSAAFRRAGGYDESFTHNEDAELDTRLTDLGMRILLAGDILIDYFPRATARRLAAQYFQYGRGRARTFLKHRVRLKARQMAPIVVAPAAVLAAFAPVSAWFAAPSAIWLSISLFYGVYLGLRERSFCACASGFAAALMHLAWSCGFIWQVATRGEARAAPPVEA